jgi:hypothetical protein
VGPPSLSGRGGEEKNSRIILLLSYVKLKFERKTIMHNVPEMQFFWRGNSSEVVSPSDWVICVQFYFLSYPKADIPFIYE